MSNSYTIMLYFLKSSQKHEHKATVQEKGVSAVLTLTIQFQPFLWNILSSQKNQPRAKKTKCTQWWQFHVIPQIQQSHYCHIQILSVTIFSTLFIFPDLGNCFHCVLPQVTILLVTIYEHSRCQTASYRGYDKAKRWYRARN